MTIIIIILLYTYFNTLLEIRISLMIYIVYFALLIGSLASLVDDIAILGKKYQLSLNCKRSGKKIVSSAFFPIHKCHYPCWALTVKELFIN